MKAGKAEAPVPGACLKVRVSSCRLGIPSVTTWHRGGATALALLGWGDAQAATPHGLRCRRSRPEGSLNGSGRILWSQWLRPPNGHASRRRARTMPHSTSTRLHAMLARSTSTRRGTPRRMSNDVC